MQKPSQRRLAITGTALALTALLFTAAHFFVATSPAHARAAYTWVGPKANYLGLGDSLAFGFQPDLDWSHGYVQDYYNNLKTHGTTSLTNYGCNGEKSNTFINGGCPYAFALHNYYLGSQLNAAVSYLKNHAGTVSPVTLDMGANDLLPDIDVSTCTVSANWATDLANLHANMVNTILPKLIAALTNSAGQRTGDLILMNYYDPYINACPNSLVYVQQINAEMTADAAQFNLPLADVYSGFGGANMGTNICTNTWICSIFKDIHAKDAGYQIIANAFIAADSY